MEAIAVVGLLGFGVDWIRRYLWGGKTPWNVWIIGLEGAAIGALIEVPKEPSIADIVVSSLRLGFVGPIILILFGSPLRKKDEEARGIEATEDQVADGEARAEPERPAGSNLATDDEELDGMQRFYERRRRIPPNDEHD